MEDLIIRETKGKYRKPNKQYVNLRYQLKKAKTNDDESAIKSLNQRLRTITSNDVMDDNFVRVKYVPLMIFLSA
jgi:hypothetical protein